MTTATFSEMPAVRLDTTDLLRCGRIEIGVPIDDSMIEFTGVDGDRAGSVITLPPLPEALGRPCLVSSLTS